MIYLRNYILICHMNWQLCINSQILKLLIHETHGFRTQNWQSDQF